MKSRYRVYHNVTTDDSGRQLGMINGYESRNGVVALVADMTISGKFTMDFAALDYLWRVFNVGDDPEFGSPNEHAVEYRKRGNRSLSVGDVIRITDKQGDRWYAVESVGWGRLIAPPYLATWHDGTVPLSR